MNRGLLIGVGGLGFGILLVAFQLKTAADLRREFETLRAKVESGLDNAPRGSTSPRSELSLGALPQRITQLEQLVAELAKTSDLLVERGMIPPSAERAEQMQARFFDPNASDRDRIRALQMMRRNGALTDDIAAQAAAWFQSSTNAGTRRDLLRQLDGLTNSVLREPLLAALGMEANNGVREELVDVLSDFIADPTVEQKFWDLALNDPSEDVRDEAEDALTEGRMTPERIESLRRKASDPQISLEGRLLALKGLGEANASVPEIVSELAQLAQNSADPVTRARIFDAFDEVRDPSLMIPLVNGLQDPNPIVRERAADALSAFGSDERIQQWLSHVIQNDADPRVQREAFRALEQAKRLPNRRN